MKRYVAKMKIFVVAVIVIACAKTTMASWLSWFGVGCTTVGVASVTYGGPNGVVVGGTLGIVEILCVAADVIDEFVYNPGGPDDATAVAFNEANCNELLSASFPHVNIGFESHPAVNVALNSYIDSVNAYISHVNVDADISVIVASRAEMAIRIRGIREALDSAGLGSIPIVVKQISAAQQSIAQNGIPLWETNYLADAGLGPTYSKAFEFRHLLADITELGDTNSGSMLNLAAEAQFERAVCLAPFLKVGIPE